MTRFFKRLLSLAAGIACALALAAAPAAAQTLDMVRERGFLICGATNPLPGFARQVANRVIFMDQGQIIEQNEPEAFFSNPQHERTKLFLSQILH